MAVKLPVRALILTCIVLCVILDVQASRRRTDSRRRVIITTRRRTSCIPRSCQYSSWGSWGECQTNCGNGTKTRTRSITVSPQCGGSCSYALSEEASCTDYTDRNCDVGVWSSWSPSCVGRCPGYSISRHRSVIVPKKCNGNCTFDLSETGACNTTGWSEWSGCNATCNENGTTTRTNACLGPTVVTQYASCLGTCCFWSCHGGFLSTGTYPNCDCVVDQSYKPNHGNRLYSYTQGYKEALVLAVTFIMAYFG
ncbi:coadhesin-like [Rhopilema esculentum]|uniref:coadhesin-like n=1 Tax=Rhopilema esculentum TaxID=499914 RepID=UPI0031E040E3